MPYEIKRPDGSVLGQVNDKAIETGLCSLGLVGRGAPDYGKVIAEDLVALLLNFASSSAPRLPKPGQIWYDDANDRLQYYTTANTWKNVGAIDSSGAVTATRFNADTNAYFTVSGGNPAINFDGNDYLTYNRTTNQLSAVINAVPLLMLTANALTVAADLLPATSANRNLGSALQKWENIYASNITATTITASTFNGTLSGAASSTDMLPDSNGTRSIGSTSLRWKDGWYTGDVTSPAHKVDANGHWSLLSGGPTLTFDANDYLVYDRANNLLSFFVGVGAAKATFGSDGTITATLFNGVAASAKYADLAERYEADGPMEPGDVVDLGGAREITKTTSDASTDVYGIISAAPAFRMNEAAGGDDTHPFVALSGRVRAKACGAVRKGQRLVSCGTHPGTLRAMRSGDPVLAIVGRALEAKQGDGLAMIEIVVGWR